MLTVEGLDAGYGEAQILFGVDLTVGEGEVVTLLGRNGMGKTTTVRSIMGLLPAKAGKIAFGGRDLTGAAPFRIAQAGIGLVPEGRQIFPTLSVEENLIATAADRSGKKRWDLGRIYAFFPRLRERRENRGNQLSGGEQQMLAIGRGMMAEPKLLILDEPSLGLSPLLVEEMFNLVRRLNQDGLPVMLVEQNVVQSLEIASRAYIVENGTITMSGTAAEISANPELKRAYLGL